MRMKVFIRSLSVLIFYRLVLGGCCAHLVPVVLTVVNSLKCADK